MSDEKKLTEGRDTEEKEGETPPPAENKKPEKKKNRAAELCKKFVKALFSQIGLTLLVGGYCVAGAYIFTHLEVPNEKDSCSSAEADYYKAENDTLGLLWDIGSQISNDGSNRDEVVEKMQAKIREFGQAVLSYGHDYETNCTLLGEDGGPTLSWNWPNTLLFAITIVTTIGYGHLGLATMWGQIVCIAYSVVGIPLMLIVLANLGDVSADIFRYVYKNVCCCGCCRKKNKDKVTAIKPAPNSAWKTDANGKPIPPETTIIEDDSDDEDDEEDDAPIAVPLTVTMLVIALWIVGGAVIFAAMEGWDFVESSYFCFITLTTIGFGDYYPNVDDMHDTVNIMMFLVKMLYIVMGMALVAMCFSLMQDEIVAKFSWIAEKLGFVSEENEEGGEEEKKDS